MSIAYGAHVSEILSIIVFLYCHSSCRVLFKGSCKRKGSQKTGRKEVVPLKKVLNFDMREREYVHNKDHGGREN